MGGWIKLDKDMVADPRLLQAAMRLGSIYHLGHTGEEPSPGDSQRFGRNALLGALTTLWEYADTHIRDDDTLPLKSDALDAFVGVDGFFELMPREWVTELHDGTVKLPGYCEKNELIAKRKRTEDAKRRQAALRARRKAESNAEVTHNASNGNALHVRDASVTKCVDQDLDQDPKKKQEAALVLGLDLKAWEEWLAYKQGSKHKLKPVSIPHAQRELAKYGSQQSAVVSNSIAHGYQGLFAPKNIPAAKAVQMNPDGTVAMFAGKPVEW